MKKKLKKSLYFFKIVKENTYLKELLLFNDNNQKINVFQYILLIK